MTPLQASATVVNLVLATGPFTYPQGYVMLGPVLSTFLLVSTCFIAYITATFMVEAISVAAAQDTKRRRFSMFGVSQYKSPIIAAKRNAPDLADKKSPFFIRQKIEVGVLAERVARPWVKTSIIVILTIYMYGAICLKFVSGAESFVAGVSYSIWKNENGLDTWIGRPGSGYYLGLFIFGFFSLYFSFGNIENAKTLQMVTTILRFVVTLLMCAGSLYYIGTKGV